MVSGQWSVISCRLSAYGRPPRSLVPSRVQPQTGPEKYNVPPLRFIKAARREPSGAAPPPLDSPNSMPPATSMSPLAGKVQCPPIAIHDFFANGDIHRSLRAAPQEIGFVPLPFWPTAIVNDGPQYGLCGQRPPNLRSTANGAGKVQCPPIAIPALLQHRTARAVPLLCEHSAWGLDERWMGTSTAIPQASVVRFSPKRGGML